MSHRVTIVVEGTEDTSLVRDFERAIRESFQELALPGSWRVVVSPSPVTNQWSLSIHALNVQHTQSMAVPPIQLSNLIPRELLESLDRSGAPYA